MRIFNKNSDEESREVILEQEQESKAAKIKPSDLLEKDNEILERLEVIGRKIDIIDKNNKKFLMTASMSKSDELEKRITSMKQGTISLLDQIDVITASVYEKADEKTKEGIKMSINGIKATLPVFGIEEILVRVGDSFNPEIHKCVETIHDSEHGEDTIIALTKRGYKDSENGLIIRPAEVIVNKI